ncbi:uncharacterized protein BO80DRAFT_439287 [Aspergillus ibericus CBS 121593]|uniref:Uncharacterized protein n=1 Tax=Aspergillus ibericus CBS 121593 TaxID=1448316 RepID=A0A395GK27_9EURO|nr:hypothetical protein BO80DRAFT_439287 [Aspergillus ibericus CBS 121593]RAK95586.1 hypothetical protein BO80DRAFT_439287 [Aspergillus ibericus CBS 121593]
MEPTIAHQTVRVSCLPANMTEAVFGRVLAGLTPVVRDGDEFHASNVLCWSLAPAISGISRYQIATITFAKDTNLKHLARALTDGIGKDGAHLTVELHFLGPTPLADPGDQAEMELWFKASEAKDSDADQAFFVSAYAVVFFGVPQKGFPEKPLTAMVKGQPNERLGRSLVGSADLQVELQQRVDECFQLPRAWSLSLYETMPVHRMKK